MQVLSVAIELLLVLLSSCVGFILRQALPKG